MADDYDVIVMGTGPARAQAVGRCHEAGFAPWWWSTNWWVTTDAGDVNDGEMLGNFSEAFGHMGVVNEAWAISEAERRQTASAG